MACQGFLVKEACIGVLVGGAGSLLSGVKKCPVVCFDVPVGLVWLWTGCMLKLRSMFLHF